MRYSIQNKELSIEAETLGGELVSVRYQGKERLWQNPTGEWAGHAPLLFPVCGHFGVTVNGTSYPIKAHGFARKSEFTLTEKGENFLTFELRANEETKKVYPYDFIFSVTYRLCGAKIEIEYQVKNPASEPLYFACGAHDSFALEKDVDEYCLQFENEKTLTHRPCNEGGYLTGETVKFTNVNPFVLPKEYLQNGDSLIFEGVESKAAVLCEKSGKALAKICFDGFENLLLWRAGDANYICIEPWTNLPDFAGAKEQEFSKKAGVLKVEPNSSKKLTRSIEYK